MDLDWDEGNGERDDSPDIQSLILIGIAIVIALAIVWVAVKGAL